MDCAADQEGSPALIVDNANHLWRSPAPIVDGTSPLWKSPAPIVDNASPFWSYCTLTAEVPTEEKNILDGGYYCLRFLKLPFSISMSFSPSRFHLTVK